MSTGQRKKRERRFVGLALESAGPRLRLRRARQASVLWSGRDTSVTEALWRLTPTKNGTVKSNEACFSTSKMPSYRLAFAFPVVILLVSQTQQQTGVLFIMIQQVQPASVMQQRQSQQPWIIWQQDVSPLVQVMHTPLSVISHLHMPIVKLQVQTIMPFMRQQQLTMPPDNIEQRFCTMLHDILSSQVQVIFMPPVHFSNLTPQRGTIMKLAGMPAGAPTGVVPTPGTPMPDIPIPARSIIIVLDI